MKSRTRIRIEILPATWYGRLFAALLAAALAVVAVFFVAFALVAGITVAALLAGRLWWVARKLRTAPDKNVIEGSYSVESAQVLTAHPESTDSNASNPSPPKPPQ